MLSTYFSDTVQHHLQPAGKANKSANTMVTQAAVKPERQPKPIAVAPVQRRKYKTKSVCLVDDGVSGPSQPAAKSEEKIITESFFLESLHNLRKDLTQ